MRWCHSIWVTGNEGGDRLIKQSMEIIARGGGRKAEGSMMLVKKTQADLKRSLTKRQRRFLEEDPKDLNATQAARRAVCVLLQLKPREDIPHAHLSDYDRIRHGLLEIAIQPFVQRLDSRGAS
jgi:hypothetical protein